MKGLIFVLFWVVLASSVSAEVYKWVDERGVVSFTDDLSQVPPRYRGSVERVGGSQKVPSTSSQGPGAPKGKAEPQTPSVPGPLIREGEFAISMAEALKVGSAKGEAEAETVLALVGIAPRNGWIADYPVTPDIIRELRQAIEEAADSRRLSMSKNEAVKAFQVLVSQKGLSVK